MLAVIVVYCVVNLVIQSVIQPKVVGDVVGLSTTLTFLSLVFWTWVLGPLGALLAVPMSLFFKAVLVEMDPDGAVGRPAGERSAGGAVGMTEQRQRWNRPILSFVGVLVAYFAFPLNLPGTWGDRGGTGAHAGRAGAHRLDDGVRARAPAS